MAAASRIALYTSVFLLSAALSVTLAGAASAGSAPDVIGQKYSDAQAAISSAGLHPVISTTVGDQKAWPDCIVSNTVARTVPAPENSAGSPVSQLLISLDCDDADASAKSPGYSAASAEGKAVKAATEAAVAAQKSSG